jgi:hypothetical protein
MPIYFLVMVKTLLAVLLAGNDGLGAISGKLARA